MMGETGQGCTSEEELEALNNPNLTRTWGEDPFSGTKTELIRD